MFGSRYRRPSCTKIPLDSDNVIEPKRARNLNYNAVKSSLGTHPTEVKLYPLELRAVLAKDNRNNTDQIVFEETDPCCHPHRCKIPRRKRSPPEEMWSKGCECANTPDVYRNILGPTPDESILAGLQTVMDICGLVDRCSPADSEEKIPYETIFESYALAKMKKHHPKRSKSHSHEEDILQGDAAYETAISESPLEISTPRELSVVSIREYPIPDISCDHICPPPPPEQRSPPPPPEQRPPPPEQKPPPPEQKPPPPPKQRSPSPRREVSHVHAKEKGSHPLSFSDSCPNSDPSGSCDYNNERWCKIDECCGTAGDSLPCVRVKAKDGRNVCIKYRCRSIQSSLSAKCFPPVEIPPCNLSCSECVIVSAGVTTSDLSLPQGAKCSCVSSTSVKKKPSRNRSARRETKSVVIQDPRASVSLIFDPKYTCNPDYLQPVDKPQREVRMSRSGIPNVQPVIGMCSGAECGGGVHKGHEHVLEVRYAIVRISVFKNYTTYEIMKSSKKKPRKIPATVEGIFVTKR